MSDTAPASGAEAEVGEEQAEAAEKKPLLRRLRRPPTALLVTLLGIALTAWLLPALSRQWDDRQSAHTVQAGIVADMTAATARVFQDGDALWVALPDCAGVEVLDYAVATQAQGCLHRAQRALRKGSARIDRPWSLQSTEIEARMRAYLSPDVVTAWQVFSWLMGIYDGSQETVDTLPHSQLELDQANQSGFAFQLAASRIVGAALRVAKEYGIYDVFRVSYIDPSAFPGLTRKLRNDHVSFAASGGLSASLNSILSHIEIELLGFEQEIAREVLNSHVTGYSTTTHDLIHDLIP